MTKPNYSLKINFREPDPLNTRLACVWTLNYNGQLYGNIVEAEEDLKLDENTIKDIFEIVVENFEQSWKIIRKNNHKEE